MNRQRQRFIPASGTMPLAYWLAETLAGMSAATQRDGWPSRLLPESAQATAVELAAGLLNELHSGTLDAMLCDVLNERFRRTGLAFYISRCGLDCERAFPLEVAAHGSAASFLQSVLTREN